MTTPLIPTIDLLSFGGDETAAAAAVRRACEDVGFFYVSGHGVPLNVVQRAFEANRRFFALPVEEKLRIVASVDTKNRGYTPMAEETLDPATQKTGDQKEGLYFGRDIPASSPESTLPLHGANLWPSEARLPGFRQAQEEYMEAMIALGNRLLRIVALALGLSATAFEASFSRPMIFLRPLRYAPVRSCPEEGLLGAGAHSDYGMLTILATDHIPGLEVLLPCGDQKHQWVDAPPKPDAFIVNLGDMLERWSNGRFRSTVHRVVNRLGAERFSIPFFFEPNFDCKVEPILQLPGEVAKYEPTTAGEHLLAKYRSTHAGYTDGGAHKP